MNIKEKRNKIVNDIYLNTISKFDKSGINTEKYKKFFDNMNDKEFTKWANSFFSDETQNIYLEILPYKNEPVLEDIIEAANYLKMPLDEYVYFRNGDNKKDPVKTAYKVPVMYVMIKVLEQKLIKKNSYSLDSDIRNSRSGQLTGDDKVARLTEPELFYMTAFNANYSMMELRGPRSDDLVAKMQMNKQIMQQGYFNLNEIDSDLQNKTTLNTVDVFLIGAGIMSDLVTEDLELKRTLDNKKKRITTQDKFESKHK